VENQGKVIIEKQLGIPPDYQFRALKGKNFLKANWHANKLTLLKHYLKLSPTSRILDLGTGSGNFEFFFAKKVKEIVGVDYNDEALAFIKSELNKKKISNVRLILSDIRKINTVPKIGRFDLIILSDVLEHIKIGEAKILITKLTKLLNPNGEVVIITPNYHSLWVVIEHFADGFSFLPRLLGTQHLAKYYRSNLNHMFTNNGFIIKRFFTFNLFSFLSPSKKISQKVALMESTTIGNIGNLIFAVYRIHKPKNHRRKKSSRVVRTN